MRLQLAQKHFAYQTRTVKVVWDNHRPLGTRRVPLPPRHPQLKGKSRTVIRTRRSAETRLGLAVCTEARREISEKRESWVGGDILRAEQHVQAAFLRFADFDPGSSWWPEEMAIPPHGHSQSETNGEFL